MLHTTPEKAIQEALTEQAKSLSKESWLCVVEDESTALTGNLFHPSALWIEHHLNDNMEVLRGFPHVAIFPRSKENAKQWESLNVGRVLSVISDPRELIPEFNNNNQNN